MHTQYIFIMHAQYIIMQNIPTKCQAHTTYIHNILTCNMYVQHAVMRDANAHATSY